MSTNTLSLFLRHLALSEEVGRLGAASDHDLLAAYEVERSQAAFTELMRRHGPMVLRTCRRILGRGPDAEDTFQATFVLLASKARQLRREAAGRRSLSGWLHRVAYRTAINVLTEASRRWVREQRAGIMTHPEADPVAEATWNEVRPILDAELNALPDEARRLLIACCLQEKTHAEAAAELGLPLGSVARHLERARGLLAKRLTRRGITVSSVLLGVVLDESAKGVGVPAVLLVHTLEAARTFTEQAAGIVTENVARLVKGGLAQMTKGWTHWSMALAGWLGLLGAGLIACQTLKAWPDQTTDSEPPATPMAEGSAQKTEKHVRADLYGDPLPPGALARLGTVRLRHNPGGVGSLVFTPDGKGLLTAGVNNLPRLWDMATGKLIREFSNIPRPQGVNGSDREFSGAVLSPDGRLLAVRLAVRRRSKCSLSLLETTTGKLLHEFKCDKSSPRISWHSLDFAFSPDGKAIAADLDGRIELRDVATGRSLWQKNKEFATAGLAFSPDGKILALGYPSRVLPSGEKEGGVSLWDARTGETLRALGYKEDVYHIAFSPDGRTLAVGYGPNEKRKHDSIHLWDVATDKEVRRLGKPDKRYVCPVFSPDGTMVAAREKEELWLWEAATGKELHRWPFTCPIDGGGPIAFSPDGKVLAALDDPLVHFWDVASGKALSSRLPTGHERDVNCVAFMPDGRTLISAGEDRTFRWWDTRTGQQRLRQQGSKNATYHFWVPPKAALSPDKKILATTYLVVPEEMKNYILVSMNPAKLPPISVINKIRTGIHLWDAATGKELRYLDDDNGCTNGRLAFSPDGKVLAHGLNWSDIAKSPTVGLWDLTSGKRYKHMLAGRCPVFSPDSSILATLEPEEKSGITAICFWEVATGKKIRSISTNEHIRCMNLSPDGNTLATGSLATGSEKGKITTNITLYPMLWGGGERTWSARHWPRGGADVVCLWDVTTGKPQRKLEASGGSPLAFSPDGKLLAAGGGTWAEPDSSGTLRLWDVVTGAQLRALEHPHVTLSVAFSPEGKTLAVGTWGSTLHLWDAVTGKELLKLGKENKEGWGEIVALSFSPDGKTLAVGSYDHKIHLLEVSTGKELHTLKSPSQHVRAVAFSPSGRLLASSDGDQIVRLWEVSAGLASQCHQFRGHEAQVTAVAFSPDGRRLASGSEDSTALVWDVTGRAGEQARVARLAHKELTALWQSLTSTDAGRAYQAMRTLAAADQTVPFLAGRLLPKRPDPRQVARLLADLDSEEFRVRSQAAKELEKLGEAVEPALSQALQDKPSVEVRRRIRQLLDAIDPPRTDGVSPRLLRWLRALEVLEWIDTPAARELLEKVAADPPREEVGRAAKATLKRLHALPNP